LISLYLKELGAKRIIVKANSSDHARILEKVGADQTIIPEEEMAVKMAHALAKPNVVDFLPLSDEYSIAEILAAKDFIGRSLLKLKLSQKYHIEVIAIKDTASGKLHFIPQPDYELTKSDVLIVLGKQVDIDRMRS